MRRLAQVAPELITTNFALAGKRGANGEKGARGKILQIGSRFYEYNVQEWGPYAHRGSEENYSELFAAAQLLTAAMVKADAPHNQVEQERARAAIRALCRSTAGPKLRPLLHDANLVGVFGFGAGNPQHTDPSDYGGGLFTPIGTAKLMFALPEFQVYVRATRGDVLYIDTPRVLHGACVPPDAATAERVGWTRQINRFTAARKEHITYGVYCPGTVTTKCPPSYQTKAGRVQVKSRTPAAY